jgi:hypothetical protein
MAKEKPALKTEPVLKRNIVMNNFTSFRAFRLHPLAAFVVERFRLYAQRVRTR